jgi:hypothetical protein
LWKHYRHKMKRKMKNDQQEWIKRTLKRRGGDSGKRAVSISWSARGKGRGAVRDKRSASLLKKYMPKGSHLRKKNQMSPSLPLESDLGASCPPTRASPAGVSAGGVDGTRAGGVWVSICAGDAGGMPCAREIFSLSVRKRRTSASRAESRACISSFRRSRSTMCFVAGE